MQNNQDNLFTSIDNQSANIEFSLFRATYYFSPYCVNFRHEKMARNRHFFKLPVTSVTYYVVNRNLISLKLVFDHFC